MLPPLSRTSLVFTRLRLLLLSFPSPAVLHHSLVLLPAVHSSATSGRPFSGDFPADIFFFFPVRPLLLGRFFSGCCLPLARLFCSSSPVTHSPLPRSHFFSSLHVALSSSFPFLHRGTSLSPSFTISSLISLKIQRKIKWKIE